MKTAFDFSKVKKASKAKSLNDMYAGGGAGDGPYNGLFIPLNRKEFTREENRANKLSDEFYEDNLSTQRYLRNTFGGEASEEEKKAIAYMLDNKDYPKDDYSRNYYRDFLIAAKQLQPVKNPNSYQREIAKFINRDGREATQIGEDITREQSISDGIAGQVGYYNPIQPEGKYYQSNFEDYDANTHYHPTTKIWGRNNWDEHEAFPSGIDNKENGDMNTWEALDPKKSNFIVGAHGDVTRYGDGIGAIRPFPNVVDPDYPDWEEPDASLNPPMFAETGNPIDKEGRRMRRGKTLSNSVLNSENILQHKLDRSSAFGFPTDLGTNTHTRWGTDDPYRIHHDRILNVPRKYVTINPEAVTRDYYDGVKIREEKLSKEEKLKMTKIKDVNKILKFGEGPLDLKERLSKLYHK
jgi:hypothetical protein